jgi:HSP20 family protein
MFGLTPWKEKEAYPFPILRNEFKALYDRFFGGWPMVFDAPMPMNRFWNVEVKDLEKEVFVRAEIPGFETEDLNVEFKTNGLLIRAEKKLEAEEKEKGYEYTERSYERFVELPVGIEPAKAGATYHNGVLEVHLPKNKEAKGFHIPVK